MKQVLFATTILSAMTFVNAAQAQQANTTTAPAQVQKPDDAGLQDIVVTAQKRSENLQKVPIAVTAIGQQQLTQAGIQTTEGLAAALPGLQLLNISGRISPRIRGVGSAATGAGFESPVATYVDGVYLNFAADVNIDLFDVAQVAAIKGPQGTLFGRNATGGVLQITTRNPEQKFAASFRGGLDNYLTIKGEAYVTGGLSDNVAASIATTYTHQVDGYGKNLPTGKDIYKINHAFSIRGKIKADLGDATTVLVSADYADRANSLGQNFHAADGLGSVFSFAAKQPGSPWDTITPTGSFESYSGGGGSVTINHTFDFAKLTSITAYRDSKSFITFDAVPAPIPALNIAIPEKSQEFTQELQLSNSGSGPFIWTVGAFYFYNKATSAQLNTFSGPIPFGLTSEFVPTKQTVKSVAVYAQSTYSLTPSTRATAGIRYTWQTSHFSGTDNLTFPDGTTAQVFKTKAGEQVSFGKPTWRLSVDQDLARHITGYISYNRGVKSGGYNLGNPENPAYGDEQLDAYETGIKSELADHKVRLNLAGFYYKYKNIQVPTYGITTIITNGASAKLYGVDVDLDARVTRQLTLNAGATLMHSEFTSFPNASTSNAVDGVPGPAFAKPATGHAIPYTPVFTTVVGATYTIPTNSGDFSLNVNDSHNSGYFGEADNVLHQKSFDYLNASIDWKSPGKAVVVRAYINNILNNNQSIFATIANLAYVKSVTNPPLVFGGSVQFDF